MQIQKILAVSCVLAMSLFMSQSAKAQKVTDMKLTNTLNRPALKIQEHKKIAKRTHDFFSRIVPEKKSGIIAGEDQLFLINDEQPIHIAKDATTPGASEFWYLVVSDKPLEKVAEEIVLTEAETALPEKFSLSQNYPNPFNPSTTIKFQLPAKNGAAAVRTVLKVYDILGRRVRTLVNEEMAPGFYTKQWNGLNDNGVRISSGVYFYSITAGKFRETKKMLLIK